MQPMLSGVAVLGRIHLACCTCICAWQKCPSDLMEKESGWLLWGAAELRTPFFRPLNEHIFLIGQKKMVITCNCTLLCATGRFRNEATKERMNEGTNEWTNERTNEWRNECTNKRTNEQTSQSINQSNNQSINQIKSESIKSNQNQSNQSIN